jgi:hypothetical protein
MQSSQDGGAAVSVSKRKTKPKKISLSNTNANALAGVGGAGGLGMGQVRTDIDGRQELIADDEERYCVCGDVSYGEMICCELDEKVSLSFPPLPSPIHPFAQTIPQFLAWYVVLILRCFV